MVVGRGLHEHLAAMGHISTYDRRKSRDNTRYRNYPLAVDLPPVTRGEPSSYGLIISVRYRCVTVDTVLCPLYESLTDRAGSYKIHISHPERQHIRVRTSVPFEGTGSPPGDYLIEIVFHISWFYLQI